MPHSRVLLYVPDLTSARLPSDRGRPRLLEKFFSRAQTAPVKADTAVLEECFGLPPGQCPIAALERLGETRMRNPTYYWWRADPVHLIADRDQLVMLPQAVLAATPEEMRQIAAAFNKDYAAEGYQLEFPEPARGYLQVPADWHCHSRSPASVAGQAMTEFMPSGPDEDAVRKLMTEIQMWLHLHPVNLARETSGQPTINSLWLWGGGRLTERLTQSPARIVASLPLVCGLGMLAGQTTESWPADMKVPGMQGEWLIALSIRDFAGDVSRLARELMEPLWHALQRGRLHQIRFYPGGSRIYKLTRVGAHRFWRRTCALTQLLRESNDPPAD